MARRKLSTFERLQCGEKLNRRERKQIQRQLEKEDPGWEIMHKNVAGIDVGNESHFVSVDPQACDLRRCANSEPGQRLCGRWRNG